MAEKENAPNSEKLDFKNLPGSNLERNLIPDEMADPNIQDFPEMSTDEPGRSPAVVTTASGGGDGGVLPVKDREELNSLNPVMQQTRLAQETFGLPSHVVPNTQQMDHVKEPFRKSREIQIAQSSGQPVTAQETASLAPQKLDPSMVATGASGAPAAGSVATALPRGRGAKLGDLDAAFRMKKEGATEQLGQQALVDKMSEVNAIVKEEAQSQIDRDMLADIDDAKAQRDRFAADVTEISRKFISGKIDPSRWYSNRTTGQKIGIAISAFLTGFGGSDSTLKMVNNAINRDIDAQKHDFNKSGGAIKNLIAMGNKIYGDDVAAAKFARGVMLENVANQLKVNTAKAKSPEAKSKLKTALSAIEIEKQKLFEKIAMDRAKLASDVRKDQKVSVEQQKRETLLQSAITDFNDLSRAFEKGVKTFSLVGENEFTLAREGLETSLGFFFSGANVADRERESFQKLVPRFADTKRMQVVKIQKLRKKMQLYLRIQRARTPDELAAAAGGEKRNKFFKPSK